MSSDKTQRLAEVSQLPSGEIFRKEGILSTAIAEAHEKYVEHADPLDSPLTWLWVTFKLAVAIWAAGMLFGGLIYYAVSPVLVAIHLGPVVGYWNCMLVALGVYGLYMLQDAAKRRRYYNPMREFYRDDAKRKQLWSTVTEPGILLLIVWIVATYLVQ